MNIYDSGLEELMDFSGPTIFLTKFKKDKNVLYRGSTKVQSSMVPFHSSQISIRWVVTSLILLNWVFNHSYEVFKFYVWTYFWTKFGPNMSSEAQKTVKNLFSKLLICTAFFSIVIRSFKICN